MTHVRLFLLGPPRIEADGAPIAIERRKALALLAYLEVTGQRHTRDALAALLWPDDEGGTARAALRRTLATLTAALGAQWFDSDREHIGLAHGAGWSSDLADFRAALRAAHNGASLTRLAQAAALARGAFLEGFSLRDSAAFDEWQFFAAEGVRRELAGALQQLAYEQRARAAWEDAIAAARHWLTLDPFHEPAHRLLIELYAEAGQRSAALRQLAECERLLRVELGSEPQPETVALGKRIRAGARGEQNGVQLARPASLQSFNLRTWADERELPEDQPPRQQIFTEAQTPFFGREEEHALIARHLADPGCRLVTLIGPGGIGKTRLALEVARLQQQQFADGAQVVSLVAVPADGCLACAISQALGITLYPQLPTRSQLFNALQGRQMLLVLDNFEHLVERAPLLNELLAHAPAVKLLVTSRERLRLRDEWALELGGLAVPPAETNSDAEHWSAIQLFVQTARRGRADFALDETNRADVVQICRLVAGIPLGIELAAAWTRMLSPGEIAREIGHNLDFLATSLRDVPERHRSIRAAFEHSWRLLDAEEQATFRRLSVFQGGFERSVAQQVAGATLVTLVALADKSLIRRRADGRYEIQELLRQYAAEQLCELPAESDLAHERHAAYYAALLGRFADLGKVVSRRQTLQDFGPEIDNVRVAWEWSVRHGQIDQIDLAYRGVTLLYETIGWFQEAIDALQSALNALTGISLPDERRRQMTRKLQALLSAALAAVGQFAQAEQIIHQALDLYADCDDPYASADAYDRLGKISSYQGKLEQALTSLQAALALRRHLPGQVGAGKTMSLIAYMLAEMGRSDEARSIIAETVRLYTSRDQPGVASTLNNLAYASYVIGEYEQARTQLDAALAIWQGGDQWFGVTVARANLGFVSIVQGRWDEARQLFHAALQTAQEMHLTPMGLDVLVGFALLFDHEQRRTQAVELLALVLEHPGSWYETRARATRLLDELRATMPAHILAAASERGRAQSYDAVSSALLQDR